MLTGSLSQDELVGERYQITRLIGAGGMGEVYEAFDRLLKEDVALKTLRANRADEPAVARQFQQEIQLARKVTHPNVCRIFEVGTHASRGQRPFLFFTMELLRGGTLAARIRTGRLSRAEAFPIAAQLAAGLEAAHGVGVVHSDFKSSNIILVPSNHGVRAVITDFGLAHLDALRVSPEDMPTQTATVHIAGTVDYMSPEQFTGEVVTAASDIYSFGIVLFEMAAGTLPFHSRHLIDAAMQRADSQSLSVRSKVHDIDPRWEAAILRCLQKDPARRFESAGEIAHWFQEGAWRDVRYWTRREWIRNTSVAGVVVAAGATGWIWKNRPYQPGASALHWYQTGMRALHSMTYESARKAFEQAIAEDARFALARASLARAYDELDNSDKAKETILKAIAEAQEVPLARNDKRRLDAVSFVVSRDYERASPLFRQIEEEAANLEKPAAALECGWLAQKREDTEEASAAYQRAMKLDPAYAAAKLRLAHMLGRQSGKDEAALALFMEAQKLYDAASDFEGLTETLLQRANLLNRRNRDSEALAIIEDALKIAHASNSPHQEIRLKLLKAVALGKRKHTATAHSLAEEAIAAADKQNMGNLATSGLVDLGNIHLAAGDLELAAKFFQEGLSRAHNGKWPRNEARARGALSSLYDQLMQPGKAREFAQAVLPFYRQAGYRLESVQTSTILGYSLGQLGEYDMGLGILREALPSAKKLDRRLEAQVYERIAITIRDRGEWTKALEDYSRAGALYSENSRGEVLTGTACVQWRLGRPRDAESSLMEAKAIAAGNQASRLLALIRVEEAEMTYADGRFEDTLRLAQEAPEGKNVKDAEHHLALLTSLARIRLGQVTAGMETARKVVEYLNQSSLNGIAASARLSLAEALWAAQDQASALAVAQEALKFFEPRKVWESVLRGHLIAGRTSPKQSEADSHLAACHTALTQMKTIWDEASLNDYLRRPDLRLLSTGLRLS